MTAIAGLKELLGDITFGNEVIVRNEYASSCFQICWKTD